MKPTTRARLEDEIAKLKRQKLEIEAQMAHVYHFASLTLEKAVDLGPTGVLVQMHYLGGKEVCPPFVLRGGLTQDTADALLSQMRESYTTATEFKPKGYQTHEREGSADLD